MIALDADTAMQVAESVGQSIDEVFDLMATHSAKQVGLWSLPDPSSPCEVTPQTTSGQNLTVTLSLDGELQGTIGLCLPKACALEWTKSLLQDDCTEIDQDVIDACGELGNIVVGGAKRRLDQWKLTMGLPNVIRAGREAIEFPTGVRPINLKYKFAESNFDVFVALAAQ